MGDVVILSKADIMAVVLQQAYGGMWGPGGGALAVSGCEEVVVAESVFRGNYARANVSFHRTEGRMGGGAVSVEGGRVSLRGVRFEANRVHGEVGRQAAR